MSLAELKSEIDRLTPEELQQIKAYTAARQHMLDPEFRQELAGKIRNQDPAQWLTLDEAEKRLFPS